MPLPSPVTLLSRMHKIEYEDHISFLSIYTKQYIFIELIHLLSHLSSFPTIHYHFFTLYYYYQHPFLFLSLETFTTSPSAYDNYIRNARSFISRYHVNCPNRPYCLQPINLHNSLLWCHNLLTLKNYHIPNQLSAGFLNLSYPSLNQVRLIA